MRVRLSRRSLRAAGPYGIRTHDVRRVRATEPCCVWRRRPMTTTRAQTRSSSTLPPAGLRPGEGAETELFVDGGFARCRLFRPDGAASQLFRGSL